MKRAALILLSVSSPLMLASFLVGGPWAGRLFAVLVVIFPASLVALALANGARARTRNRVVVAGLGLMLTVPSVALLALPSGTDAGLQTWVLGLPRATALMLIGLGLVPLLVTPLAYALTFRGGGPRPETLPPLARRLDRP